MAGRGEIQQITYLRRVRPPTLRQYLVRRKVRSLRDELAKSTGLHQEEGRVVPKAAATLREAMRGLTADRIAELYPQWVEDYQREHGRNPDPG